jgi:hypothetical protein
LRVIGKEEPEAFLTLLEGTRRVAGFLSTSPGTMEQYEYGTRETYYGPAPFISSGSAMVDE